MVVVQAPHAMRPGRLYPVRRLQPEHELRVSVCVEGKRKHNTSVREQWGVKQMFACMRVYCAGEGSPIGVRILRRDTSPVSSQSGLPIPDLAYIAIPHKYPQHDGREVFPSQEPNLPQAEPVGNAAEH